MLTIFQHEYSKISDIFKLFKEVSLVSKNIFLEDVYWLKSDCVFLLDIAHVGLEEWSYF